MKRVGRENQRIYIATIFRSAVVKNCLVWPLFLVACSGSGELKDFASDGCSLFPDASPINETDWYDCCFEHDVAYWQGGTREQRQQADDDLRACVVDKTGSQELGDAMYLGVRGGGSPYFYNWYRWGYGWDYQRKYQALTGDEQAQVRQKLDSYFATADLDTVPPGHLNAIDER